METFADDMLAVIEKLGLRKSALVGFSMGAPVVIEAAGARAGTSGLLERDAEQSSLAFGPEAGGAMDDPIVQAGATQATVDELISL
jgi:pimeloyl-ACP methyl ester carboxylesterase